MAAYWQANTGLLASTQHITQHIADMPSAVERTLCANHVTLALYNACMKCPQVLQSVTSLDVHMSDAYINKAFPGRSLCLVLLMADC